MSVLEQALSKLDRAVVKAEHSMGRVEGALSGQQRDMFGEPLAAKSESYIDGSIVAEKLNKTIEKMEGLLENA